MKNKKPFAENLRLMLLASLLSLCFIGVSGAAVIDSEEKSTAVEPLAFTGGLTSVDEPEDIQDFHPQDTWQFFAASGGVSPALTIPANIDVVAHPLSPDNTTDSTRVTVVTLNVRNIQVRAKWGIIDDTDAFKIEGNVLLLTSNKAMEYVVTVFVEDEFDLLNDNYINLTAQAILSVNVISPGIGQVSLIFAVAGKAQDLYTLSAGGGEDITYTIEDGNTNDYFFIAASVLSVKDEVEAATYILSIKASDTGNSGILVTVEVVPPPSLENVPRLYGVAGQPKDLHTFTASGGIGAKMYTIIADYEEDYFTLDAGSGALRLLDEATAEVYIFTVQTEDTRNNIATVLVTVEVAPALILADAPPFYEFADMTVSLHTFAASGGFDNKTYTIIAGNKSYFALNADSGVLSLQAAVPGIYTLTVEAKDEHDHKVSALATIDISVALSLAEVPLLSVIVDTTVNLHTLDAGGGFGVKTYTIIGGDDEGHFALDADSGVLSLQAAVPDVYRLVVQAKDERDHKVLATVTVEIAPVLMLAVVPTLYAFADTAVSLYIFAANGGFGSKTYTIIAANEKDYFAIDAQSGVLSLSAAATGIYTLTVQAEDELGHKVSVPATIDISVALLLAEVPLLSVIVDTEVDLYTLTASGGFGVKTYIIVAGNEKKYFALDAGSGLLSSQSGSATGIYRLTVRAVDIHRHFVEVVATVEVLATLSLVDVPLLRAAIGEAVSLHTFATEGGIGAKTYTIIAGNEKDYFALEAASGVLSLLANAPIGLYTLTVQVTDEQGTKASVRATIQGLNLFLADAPSTLYVIVGEAVGLHTFSADGEGGGNTYAIINNNDGYFAINDQSGVLSVNANAPIALYTLTVQAMDAESNTATAMAIVEVVPSLSLLDTPRLYGVAGQPKDLYTLTASGGILTKNYIIFAGNEKNYFALDAQSGVLRLLTEATAGVYTLTVQTEDTRKNITTALATVEVAPPLILANAPPFYEFSGITLSLHTFAASGGFGSKTYTIIAGNKDYFVLNAQSGVLSLSAAVPGNYILTVQATDERGHIILAQAEIAISAALSLADAPPRYYLSGMILSVYTFVASGGFGAKTYTIVAGYEKDYFAIDAQSGVLSLSAAAPGMYTLTIQAKDRQDNTVTALATIDVSLALILADTPPFYRFAGITESLYTLTAIGGFGKKTYTIIAGNKDYFSLDAQSGVLSLSAAVPGNYTLTIQAKDERDYKILAKATIAISTTLSLADAPPRYHLSGMILSVYTFVASGGFGAKTYTIVAGYEKDYFAIDAQSGVLSLSVAAPGIYTLTIQAKDREDNIITALATIDVSLALLLADAPTLYAFAGVTVSLHTFAAIGGFGDKTYTITAGNGEGYFAIDAQSGVLSLSTAAVTGNYILAIQATDERDHRILAQATIAISATLSLANAPRLYGVAGQPKDLHTFTASGGFGDKTYTIIAGNKSYFAISVHSGVLRLLTDAVLGIYTLTVQAEDIRSNIITALATVEVAPTLILTDAPTLYAIVGRAVSLHTFTVSGGFDGKTYAIANNEDGYFAINAQSGALSVLANAAVAIYTLTVQATDIYDHMVEVLATVEVLPSLFLSDAPTRYGAAGQTNDLHTFTASGGIGAKTYTIIAGHEQGYFALDKDSGVLSLQAAALGIYTLTVQVEDGRGNMATALATVEVLSALRILGVPRLYGFAGATMNLHTLSIGGGTEDITYAIIAGNKLGYFAIGGANSDILSLLTTAQPGNYTLTIQVQNALDLSSVAPVTVEVSAVLALADARRFYGVASQVTSFHTFAASGGFGAKTYTIVAGNDDNYFVLNAQSGALSFLISTEAGLYTLTVQAEDTRGNTADALITMEISPILAIGDVPKLTVDSRAATIYAFTVSGGFDKKVFTIAGGNEQGRFDLSADGVLSLQAGVVSLTVYTLAIEARDARNNITTALVTVEVFLYFFASDAPPIQKFAGKAAHLHTFSSEGGVGAKTYAIKDNAEGYFTINPTSGELSLVVAPPGFYTLTIQVSDERKNTTIARAEIELLGLVLLNPPLYVIVGEDGSFHTLTASGGEGATYSIIAGNEAGHFALNAESGVFSAMNNTVVTAYRLTVQVVNGVYTVQAPFAVYVRSSLSLATVPYLYGLTAPTEVLHYFYPGTSGGIGTRTYTIIAGNEYNDFVITSLFGNLSRLSAAAGIYTVTVQVEDVRHNTATAWVTIEIANALVFEEVPSFYIAPHVAMTLHTLTVSGGFGKKTYSRLFFLNNDSNHLTESFGVNAQSGVLSVDPNVPSGNYIGRLQATDERRFRIFTDVMVAVAATISLADASLHFFDNMEIVHTLAASGGFGDKTYTIVAGNDDFALDAQSGVLSLSVATHGIYTLTVEVRDGRGNTDEALATIAISAVLSLAEVPSFYIVPGVAMTLHTLTASGGFGVKTYTIFAGNGDGYFALDAQSGILSVKANSTPGDYLVQVRATDEQDFETAKTVTVAIAENISLADASLYIFDNVEIVHTLAASGGFGDKTYTIVAGNDDFALDAQSGVLSVSVATQGMYTLTVRVRDGRGNTDDALATIAISAVLSLADAPSFYLFADREAVTLHKFIAGGGFGVKTYTITDGNVANRFTLDAQSGILSLQAVVPGVYTLAIQAKDERDHSIAALATIEIVKVLSLADASLYVLDNVGILLTFAAIGGFGDKTYTIEDGNDDGDFALNAQSGVLALAAADHGIYTLTVRVRDGRDNTDDALATIAISAVLSLAEVPPLSVIVDTSESLHTFAASGGFDDKTYIIINGSNYFDLSADSGALSLRASVAIAVYMLTVQVIDARNHMTEAVVTVEVLPPLSLADAPRLYGVAAQTKNLHTLSASGGFGANTYTIAATEKDYFALDAQSGVLRLLTNAVSGIYTVTVQTEDIRSNITTALATVEVAPALILAEVPLLSIIVDTTVSLHTFAASGGFDNKTYTIIAGNEEEYFALNADSGALSLQTGAAIAIYTLTVQAIDVRNHMTEAVATVEVLPTLSLDAPLLRAAVSQTVDLHTFAAVGGIGAKTYTIIGDYQEEYFALNAASGVLTLLGKAPLGFYTLTVQVADEQESKARALATIQVLRLVLADAPPLYAIVGEAVSLHTFAAQGGIGENTYTIIAAGKGRDYFALDAQSGVLSVLASATIAIYTLTVQAMNTDNNMAPALAIVEVVSSLSLANAPRFYEFAGVPKDLHTFAASGGIGAKTYTIIAAGKGRDYFALNAHSGVLRLLTNAVSGMYTLTVQAEDTRNNSDTALATVEVSEPLTLADAALYAFAGVTVSLHTFTAGGGFGGKTYTIIAGNEEDYFVLNADSGVLSLSAAALGNYTLTIQVEDGYNQTVVAVATVAVSTILSLAGAPPLDAFTGMILSLRTFIPMSVHTFTAGGGFGAKTYSIIAGAQDYFAIGAASGVLSVRVSAAMGTYTLTVQAEDSQSNAVTALATIRITAPFPLVLVVPPLTGTRKDEILYIMAADGGVGKITYAIIDGNQDGRFALDADGVLSLQKERQGAYELHVEAVDSDLPPSKATAVVSIIITRKIFMLGGANINDVWSSPDGKNWRQEATGAWTKRQGYRGLVHNGSLYVMGGWTAGSNRQNDVWSSPDGISWARINHNSGWDTRQHHEVVSHNGRMYLMGGFGDRKHRHGTFYNNDVWSSADGITWQREGTAGWATREKFQAVSHNGRIYVIGGNAGSAKSYRDDVWSSADGRNWRLETKQDWLARKDHAALSHNGRIYVMGGHGRHKGVQLRSLEDVWSSADGKNWVQEAAGSVWPERELHDVVSFSGRMYLMGGQGPGVYKLDYFRDVLSSNDGKNWVRETPIAGWEGRRGLQLVVFPPPLDLPGPTDRVRLKPQTSAEIHTFQAQQGDGNYTYSLFPQIAGFSISNDGVLSTDDTGQLGDEYILGVLARDGTGNWAQTEVRVYFAQLTLADARLTVVPPGSAVNVHTLVAKEAVGVPTFAIVSGNGQGFFALDPQHSNILFMHTNVQHGVYPLLVEVTDSAAPPNRATAMIMIEAAPLFVADASLSAPARYPGDIHTFTVSGGEGTITYAITGGDGYFAIGAGSGVLSVASAELGTYNLLLEVVDSAEPPNRVTAAVKVEIDRQIIVLGGQIADESVVSVTVVNDVSVSVTVVSITLVEGVSVSVTVASVSVVSVTVVSTFVVNGVSAVNDVWSSLDGKAWRQKTAAAGYPARVRYQAVVHNGQIYVMGGSDQAEGGTLKRDVYSSKDGVNWKRETPTANWSARVDHRAVSHQGRIYVLGGFDGAGRTNDVWSSPDGDMWRLETAAAGWSARREHEVVSHNGRIYVMGGRIGDGEGYLNDVWSSADGKTWTQETAVAEWFARRDFQAVSHRGRLYVMGGNISRKYGTLIKDDEIVSDVWSSADGKTWVPESLRTLNSYRYQLVSYHNRLYSLGGYNGGRLNDVWSSADGVLWGRETPAAIWAGRVWHQAVVFP